MTGKPTALLKTLLPGLATVGFTIGTGSVTAMAKSGANHGTALLWALLLSCWISCVLLAAFGRLTVLTRTGALEAIRTHLHPALAAGILGAVWFNVGVSITGVMGVIADVLAAWSRDWFASGVPPIAWAAIVSAVIAAAMLRGSVKRIELVLAVLAGVMGVCFLVNAAFAWPGWAEVARGLIPTLPPGADGEPNRAESALLVASIVGTTVAPVVLLFRALMIREEDWGVEQLAVQRRDAVVSAVLIFLICAAVMTSATGVLYDSGLRLDAAHEMIGLLEPAIGPAAVVVFVVGITAAGVSSQFPNIAALPCLLRDFQRRPIRLTATLERTMIVAGAALGLLVPAVGSQPVAVMILSQALNAVVLPVVVGCVWLLLNRTAVVGPNHLRASANVTLGVVMVLVVLIAGSGVYGIYGKLAG
ncbi:divalent metal cation transporter [Botrimarina sp.]|uniref:NRAMP family divalent metal transporter n=1 Tax=Botrimarina sp. TaxID=2795802 RepID=UPI0032EB065A